MTFPEDKAPVLLSNRYRVLKLLGDGGFGKTYLVEDAHMPSGRQCVLKQLKPIEDDPEAGRVVQERFQREAATLEKLGETHDQIPRLYAYFSQDEQFYLVTEWIEGHTLTQKIQSQGTLLEADVKKMLVDLLGVIAYVHRQGIVHRDIKPDNVILRKQDGKPVLIDFGAVKETMNTQLSLHSQEAGQFEQAHTIVIGTPGYMPAEQMSGHPTYASDLYSLGMTAIYLLTGRIPQELGLNDDTGEWLWRQHVPGISAGFANFLDCAIHRDPRTRFPSADSMLSILNTLIADDATRTVAGFELSPVLPETAYPDPTIASPAASAEPTGQYAQADPTYEVPYELTENVQPVARSHSLRNAIIIGSLVGCSALAGVLLAMERSPNVFAKLFNREGAVVEAADSQIDPPPAADDEPVEDAPPAPIRRTTTPNANATVAGLSGSKNVRARAGTLYAVVDSVEVGDRVQVTQRGTDPGGNAWYKITTPSGQVGWIAGQLLQIDGNASLPTKKPDDQPTDSSTPGDSASGETDNATDSTSENDSTGTDAGLPIDETNADETNAVLIGEPGSKNIRSGPGIRYDKLHEAFPGDRVIITDSDRDSDNYLWYEVSFPKSGAKGWIAAQLVKKD